MTGYIEPPQKVLDRGEIDLIVVGKKATKSGPNPNLDAS